MNCGVEVDIQLASRAPGLPDEHSIRRWVGAALASVGPADNTVLTVRIVDEEESRALNQRFRGRDAATNVLSFPAAPPQPLAGGDAPPALGDIVICAPLVFREAEAQGKQSADHFAHLLVHGVLHLKGFDHEQDAEAEAMEALEIRILADGGIGNPYVG